MDQFVEQLRQVSPLSDEIVGQLLEEMKEVSFAKGELSIREGSILFIGISPPIMFKWWRIRHY